MTSVESPKIIEDTSEVETPVDSEMLTANEMQFAIPDEAVMHLNQMNAAIMAFTDQIDQRADNPMMKITNEKYMFYEGDVPIMEADWHLISEFRILEMDESTVNGELQKIPTKIEYIWGWAIRPDDPHTTAVTEVTESLPSEMNPLTFPMFQFGDIGVLEVLHAYSMEVLKLDYIMTRYSDDNKSYGVFGLYNLNWLVEPMAIKSRQMRQIVAEVKRVAKTLRVAAKKEGNVLGKDESVASAWKDPYILALVTKYRRDKHSAEQTQKEFTDLFEKAQKNPDIMFDTPEGDEEDVKSSTLPEQMNNAMDAIEAALKQVDAEEQTQAALNLKTENI